MPNQRNANRLKQKTTKGLAAWDFRSDKSKARLNDKPEKTPEVMGEESPMAAFDNIPRETQIMGQPHMLSYINPQEEAMLQKMRGGMPPLAGPGGVPSYFFFGGETGFGSWGDSIADSWSGGDGNDNNNSTVTVSSGDTLSEIAEDNNMSVAEIMADNPDITDPDQIQVGQTLDLSSAGSGSDTYADGVGLGGIGSEEATTTGASQSEITTTVLDPDEFDPRGDQIVSPTSNGAGVVTNATGYDDLEDDTDFSIVPSDNRDDLSFDLTDPTEPLVTGNNVNFTGTYEGVTYVDGYPETAPLQVTIDESTYVPGQDTFESTFLSNYGVSVPTSESEFMALPDGAKKDLALLPKDDMEDLLQTISTTSGDNSNVATNLINFGADLIGVRGVGDDPYYQIVESEDVDLLPPETETTPLNVELISTEDFEKLTNNETFMDDAVAEFYLNQQKDSSVVGGYDEAGLNVGGDVGATDDDLATDFSAFDTTGTDSSVVGGYDEAGLNVLTTENDSNTEVADVDDVEIIFNNDGSAVTGDGDEFDDVQGAVNNAIDGNGKIIKDDGSGDGEGSGSGTGDGEGDGSGQEEVVDDTVIETDPIDSYRVDPNFAVRDLMADFQRRRKGGTGYGLPKYMQRYMSGEIVDELVRRVELDDGTILYQTPDGRFLDPEEFIGTAELGDEQSIKIGDEEYQTGYTTTNLKTGQAVRYDMSGNPIIT